MPFYDFLGDTLTAKTEAAMGAELSAHADMRHRVGAHRYGLATFGLSADEVERVFARYIAAHDIEREAR